MVHASAVKLPRSAVRRPVAIAGQVMDAITRRVIPGATVSIIDAPDPLIQQLRGKAKALADLQPRIWVRSRLPLPDTLQPSTPDASQSWIEKLKRVSSDKDKLAIFQSFFAAYAIQSADKWTGLDQMLNDSQVSNSCKLSMFQFVLDACSVPLDSPLSLVRTQAAADGWFHFLDLPGDGNYTLQACLPGAGTRYGVTTFASVKSQVNQEVQVTVYRDGEGYFNYKDDQKTQKERVKFYPTQLHLVPTTLAGRVTDAEGEGVKFAKVQLAGRREFAVTSDESGSSSVDVSGYSLLFGDPFNNGQAASKNKVGYYILSGLEAFTPSSNRSLRISVVAPEQGGDRAEVIPTPELEKVSLQPGEIRILNFRFQPKSNS